MAQSNQGAVRKSILRNVERPVVRDKPRRIYASDTPPVTRQEESRKNLPPTTTCSQRKNLIQQKKENDVYNNTKLVKPMLNTALRIQKKITALKSPKEDLVRGVLASMDQQIESLAKEKLNQQLNFPPQKKVFTNLVPANINDSVLLEELQQKPKPPKQPSHARTGKDPAPNLLDYLTPLKPFERKMDLEFPPEEFQPANIHISKEEIQVLFELSDIG